MAETVLKFENVTMQFGGVVAVSDLNYEVKQGEIAALIGPNGAGKTTAFNVATGMYAPTNGRVTIFGRTVAEGRPTGKMRKLYAAGHAGEYQRNIKLTPDKITAMGVARTFQNIRLFRELTVLENVMIAMHLHVKGGLAADTLRLNLKEEKKMKADAEALLKELTLGDVKDERAGNLPYGRQRILEIVRALATKPRLLLLDEPAAGMNPQETKNLGRFITDIREKFQLTIFMIEHHMNLVMDISERICVIDFGLKIAEGAPGEIRADPKVIAAYLGVDEA